MQQPNPREARKSQTKLFFPMAYKEDFITWAKKQGYKLVYPLGEGEVFKLEHKETGEQLPYYKHNGLGYIKFFNASARLYFRWMEIKKSSRRPKESS